MFSSVPTACECFWLAALIVLLLAGVGPAGGGPENVLLVVNRRSWASISVANHYIRLRSSPRKTCCIWIGPASLSSTGIETFRQQILRPILAAIERNELDDHIDYIVYSSDFPWSVDCSRRSTGIKLPDYLIPIGSLTGMTYLWPLVWGHQPDWLALNSNHYVRPEHPAPDVPATHGFRSWYGWSDQGALLEAGGQHYMLSTTLAVTSGRGNSLGEVVDYLSRTRRRRRHFAQRHDLLRRHERHPLEMPGSRSFGAAVDELAQLGVQAEIDPRRAAPSPAGRTGRDGGLARFLLAPDR